MPETDTTDDFPLIPKELIEAMERCWPIKPVQLGWGLDKIYHEAGKTSVVAAMRARYEKQIEETKTDGTL